MQNNFFAHRLRESMKEKNMKQIDIMREAEKRGIKLGKSHVSQYVSGKTIPRDNILNVLAEILEVEPGWLKGKNEDSSLKRDGSLGNAELKKATEKGSDSGKAEPGKSVEKIGRLKKTESGKTVGKDSDLEKSESIKSFEKSSNSNLKEAESAEFSVSSKYTSNMKRNSSEGVPMKEFRKSSKLDNVLYDVRGPVVEEAARMEEAGTHVLKLNIGNPAPFGFRAPDEVIYDMRSQLTECEGYSHSKGLFSARKAIMQYMQNKNVPNVTIEDIYTGNGVSELINLSLLALLNTGDEVLVPSPDYPLWTACVTLAGGKAVHYICDEEAEWNPDIDDIKKKITDRTKAIVIINPNNPTGALYSKDVLKDIVKVAREHQLIIFSDEIYDRLIFNDEEHTSIAALAPDLFCVTFSGLSKSHMVAGYRVGWMVLSGNKRMAKDYIEGLNMLSNMRLCSNVPAQSIVQTSLGGYQSVKNYIKPGGRVYEQCEYIYKALNDIPGVSTVKPKAGFYIFPKLDVKKFNITDDEKFTFDLLRDKKILLISGKGFNWKQPDHFRIVYLPRIEVLEEAVDKMADFFSYYRQ